MFRRDGRAAEMVMAELAGAYEAPIYGMLDVNKAIRSARLGCCPSRRSACYGQPSDESRPTILWDGEWEITYVTFRDMGAAFMVAIFGIYILVVAQFKSFRLPLVILTPIPLTLIGIVIGHILFNAPFTATSMIGFIALAGIIVRNSILLVDFIRHAETAEKSLRDVLLEAGAIRFKPILLTAVAAMIGAGVILTRSDLPGARDLAAVRARLVDTAYGAGDPRDLRRDARRRDAVGRHPRGPAAAENQSR
jgi:multidrug efflux pump subunit AcrB